MEEDEEETVEEEVKGRSRRDYPHGAQREHCKKTQYCPAAVRDVHSVPKAPARTLMPDAPEVEAREREKDDRQLFNEEENFSITLRDCRQERTKSPFCLE